MTKTPAFILALSIALALPAYAEPAKKIVKTIDFTKSSPYAAVQAKPTIKTETKPHTKATAKIAAKSQTASPAKPTAKSKIKTASKTQANPTTVKTTAKPNLKTTAKTKTKPVAKPAAAAKVKAKPAVQPAAPLFAAVRGQKTNDSAAAGNKAIAQASSGARQSIIHTAQKYLGTPYRWGGITPHGFDCSGLTSYVFRQKGITLPRTAAAQYAALSPVKNPQPGDLVFFRHKSGRIGHVGLYIGGGKMIHAPQTGERVRIESMEKPNWRRRYAGARSVLPHSQIYADNARKNDGRHYTFK